MTNPANIRAFNQFADDYDNWFERHTGLYQSELKAIKKFIPGEGRGIEIGLGTGRFASQLGITIGIEPSHSMAQMALARGIRVVKANAEELPFFDLSFDYALMVTTVCFLDNIPQAFNEAYRVLKRNGLFIVGLIDKDSRLGKKYEAEKSTNSWYRDAHFHSTEEITQLLQQAGFSHFEYCQTLVGDNETVEEEPMPGYGKGGFVVIKAGKIV
ncbi:MAG: class I SAM-dependent methyltransferase [Sphingobacteriales bacterium]|nr:class I SAM-dependent methyltransferase [Sphingobacteriales bacterium]